MANIKESIKTFYAKSVRVWHVLKKPTKEEFLSVAKVSAIGIGVIGLLGFLISIILGLFTKS